MPRDKSVIGLLGVCYQERVQPGIKESFPPSIYSCTGPKSLAMMLSNVPERSVPKLKTEAVFSLLGSSKQDVTS